jgi:hypothetical protein
MSRQRGSGTSTRLERGVGLEAPERPTDGRQMSSPQPQPRPRRSRKGFRGRRARRREARLRRRTIFGRHPVLTVLGAVVLGLTPVWVSLATALTNPGLGSSAGARLAEWARENGGASIVNWAENTWYSHHQPAVGGAPAKGAIPAAPSTKGTGTSPSGHLVAHLAAPAPIQPFAKPAIAGEGVWHAAGRKVDGLTSVYEAFMRPDPVHTSLVVGVAWMDTKLLRATLYSGSTIPGGGPYPDTAPILPAAAKSVVAAFNAGFLMGNANGGYYTNGHVEIPLRKGAASVVVYRNGNVTVADWGRDATMTPNVVAVRQNLDLLVDGGKPVGGLNANDTIQWGYTLGNQVYVWRSGVGVTADGALVYVGGPGLNITTLADLLVRAGAVRAMELDINTDWVNLATYNPSTATGAASAANGTDLLPGMVGTPARYFESWWSRDFFTMSARSGG